MHQSCMPMLLHMLALTRWVGPAATTCLMLLCTAFTFKYNAFIPVLYPYRDAVSLSGVKPLTPSLQATLAR